MRAVNGVRTACGVAGRLAIALAAITVLGGAGAMAATTCPPAALSVATTPVPMQNVDKYTTFLDQTKKLGNPVDVVLFGDSLMEGWSALTPPLKNYKVMNLGLGNDTTQNTLWRLQQIQSNALNPKIVIMTLGTNNLGLGDPACGIAEGVRRALSGTHALWPTAQILYIAIPPRGPYFDFRDDVRIAANNEIKAFAAENPWVEFINVDSRMTCDFYGKVGDVDRLIGWIWPPASRCPSYKPDSLHWSSDGYAVLGGIIGSKREP